MMGNIKKLLSAVLILVAGTAVFARQIAIQIVQHDETSEEVSEQSFVIEDELMDGFFENGYIVTNSPASISKSENQDNSLWSSGLGDAWEGSSDYFVQVRLYYSESLIKKIEWSLASVSNGKKIKSSSLHDFNDAKNLSSYLIKEIKEAIKA